MAPSVKVRLEVEGAPEAVAAVRQFTNQSKAAGKEASASFAGLSSALSGVTKLFAAYQVARVTADLARFTVETVKLAAEQKDLALALGTTIENFSAMSAVAKATNTEQSKLVAGLGAMADRIKDLRQGSPEVAKAFRQLGLGAKDFATDDVVVNAVKIGEALEKVARGGTRGAIAVDVLGKSGRALLPVFAKLNELGGLEGAIRFAKELGFFVDAGTIAKLDEIASAMQEMELRARGIALQFAKGFGPQVLIAMRQVQTVLVDGKTGAEIFGEAIGQLARGIAELTVHTIAWGTVLGDVFTLQFAKAREDFERFDKLLKEMRAAKPTEPLPFDDSVGRVSSAGAGASDALARKKQDAELENLRALHAKEEAQDKVLLEKKLITLDEYFAKRKARYLADHDFRLDLLSKEIDAVKERGDAAEAEILEIQRSTLLVESAKVLTELEAELAAAREPVRKFADDLRTSLTQALTDFATNGINQVHSLTDAFRQLGSVVASAVQQVAGTWLVKSLMGFIPGFASGGMISGPGTGTSDSIPAMVSRGEYIVRAGAVASPGMLPLLNAINREDAAALGAAVRGLLAMPTIDTRPRYFAEGGLVDDVQRSPMAAGAGSSSVNGQIGITLDDGLILRAIESPAGQRVLLKVMSKSPRAFGSAIRR